MYLDKLKIEQFNSFSVKNFPESIDLGIESSDKNFDVVIYYIDAVDDVTRFVDFCNGASLPDDNRTIMIYKKGRKDGVNRDSIFGPFREGKFTGFKLKAPMLCSLSKELSACVMSKEVST